MNQALSIPKLRTASMEIGTSNGNFIRPTAGREALSRNVGALRRVPSCLSCNPGRPGGTPHEPSLNPEMLSSNPDAASFDPETLSFDPDTLRFDPEALSFDPEALRFDPETPSFDVFDRKSAANTLNYSHLQQSW